MSTLIVAPHMDDEVLGCGGLIQKTADVHVVYVTELLTDVRILPSGERVEYNGERRIAEMRTVAACLGFSWQRLSYRVHSLDRLKTSILVERIDQAMSGLDVDTLIMPGPSHDQDHEKVRIACEAIARPHHFSGSVLEYFTWGNPSPYEPAMFVPLSDSEMSLKIKAMELYQTQVSPGGNRDELYPYSPESVRTFGAGAGRLIHEKWAEPYSIKRMVVR